MRIVMAVARRPSEARRAVASVERDRERLDPLGDGPERGCVEGDAHADGVSGLRAPSHHDENDVLTRPVGPPTGFNLAAPKIVNPEPRPMRREPALSDAVFGEESIAAEPIEGPEDGAAIGDDMAVGRALRPVRVAADERGAALDGSVRGGSALLTAPVRGRIRAAPPAAAEAKGETP